MTYCLGLDIGYSNLKMVMGEVGKTPKEMILPAGAGPSSKLPTQLSSGESEKAIHIMLNGESWVAGVPADFLENWERSLADNYSETLNYRALFYAALLKTGRDKIDKLVTGLPVSHYMDFAHREALAESLKGVHQVSAKRSVEVSEVVVLPQPVGAYMHLLSVSDDDLIDTMEEGNVIVLDPGYFSVDWVAMQGRALRKGSSGTSHKAMSRILEVASTLLLSEHGKGACTKEKIENAIRGGKRSVLVFGERIEIAPYMERAVSEVAPQAMSLMSQAMREEAGGADIVLLAGGGGAAFREEARKMFPRSKIILPQSPVLANAQGFWFYGN